MSEVEAGALVHVQAWPGGSVGDLADVLGTRVTFVLTALVEAASIATIAVAPDNLVAVTVLWATRVYTGRPSTGVAVASGTQGVSLLCGPLTGGLLAETTTLTTALLAGATIVAACALLVPREDVIH